MSTDRYNSYKIVLIILYIIIIFALLFIENNKLEKNLFFISCFVGGIYVFLIIDYTIIQKKFKLYNYFLLSMYLYILIFFSRDILSLSKFFSMLFAFTILAIIFALWGMMKSWKIILNRLRACSKIR